MLRGGLVSLMVLAALFAALLWLLTAPESLEALPQHQADIANGERMFHAGGCSSCHAAPKAEGDEALRLGGGLELNTSFGVFRVPNISPDPETGIGRWSTLQFVSAVTRGVSPSGSHYFPAFPYGSYARMTVEDVIDLKAFLDGLPPVANEVGGHGLRFPFSVRRGVGIWKLLYFDPSPIVALDTADALLKRGQYLVEGPGHCGECHTSRDLMGGLKKQLWLAGAPNPEGRGTVPNITPHAEGTESWSIGDLVYAFESGLKPDFDAFGAQMAAVQEELARLPDEDRQAIAAYLKAIPPLPDAVKPAPQPGS